MMGDALILCAGKVVFLCVIINLLTDVMKLDS